MQPDPAADERAAEPSDLLPERSPASEHEPTPAPALVLRPKLQWLAAGPGLVLLAVLLLATGRLLAVPVALVLGAAGVAFLPAWRDRVDLGPDRVVRRSWRGRHVVALADVDTLRLRRIAFPFLRWIHRGYKFGRFWSIPLTLRLMHGEENPLLDLRCGWWHGWRELTRAVIALDPEIDLDQRTRGRLERYVGVPLPASSQR
jgi:hypothetical protein